jgi:hypothetical protein
MANEKYSDLLNITNNQNLEISDKSSQVCELKLEIQKLKNATEEKNDQKKSRKSKFKREIEEKIKTHFSK